MEGEMVAITEYCIKTIPKTFQNRIYLHENMDFQLSSEGLMDHPFVLNFPLG